jgi:4-amino-4-deoxy-L-arabinose transferase-like glycosyltransferase
MIAGIGWYIGQTSIRFHAYGIGVILLLAIFLSSQIYFGYLSLIFRVGSYIAVFWESFDPERGLQWHRFARNTQFQPNMVVHVNIYRSAACIVFVILFLFGFTEPITFMWVILLIIMIVLFLYILGVLQELPDSVSHRRIADEKEWRRLKESEEEQKRIHRLYETL